MIKYGITDFAKTQGEIDTGGKLAYNRPEVLTMKLMEDRRALHRIPELDRNLPETLCYLRTALDGLNCRVFSPMEGALCAFFDFGNDIPHQKRHNKASLCYISKVKALFGALFLRQFQA